MVNVTKIEWATHTSNPIKFRDKATGKSVWSCVRKSPGCAHCYAATLAKRYGRGGAFTEAEMSGYECYLDEAELKALLSPKRVPPGSAVFLGDMTDIFGPWVPFAFLDRVFAVMALRPDVVFMLLTKRPDVMRKFVCDGAWDEDEPQEVRHRVWQFASLWSSVGSRSMAESEMRAESVMLRAGEWPLPNVWMGTSVENQHWADVRLPDLLATPAAVRFVSAEPLLGPVDLMRWKVTNNGGEFSEWAMPTGIHWVIPGGESGAGARPCDIGWIRSIRDQCRAAGVACFVKQLGARPVIDYRSADMTSAWSVARIMRSGDPLVGLKLKSRKGSNMDEWPADLRVRGFPNVPDERTNQQLSAEIARRLLHWTQDTIAHLHNDFKGEGDPLCSCVGCADGSNAKRRLWVSPDREWKGEPVFASDHNASLGLVVPEMRRRGYEFMAEDFAAQSSIRVWFVKGSVMGSSRVPFGQEPRAICLAALAALDQERTNIATAEYSLCPFCYKSLDGEIGFHYECGQREERRSEWESEQGAALDAERHKDDS